MSKDNKFSVYYDDQPHDAVSKIDSILNQFGINIIDVTEDGSEILEYEVIKTSTEEETKGYLVETGHNSGYENSFFVKTEDEAIEEVHDFFLSYDFEIIDGKPYDAGNDDGENGGFEAFGDQWKVIEHNGEFKVTRFVHCDGDGPVGSYRENG